MGTAPTAPDRAPSRDPPLHGAERPAQAVDLNAKTVKKSRGFKLALSASQGQGGFSDSLNANLAKGLELNSYFFSKGITFTAAADLSSSRRAARLGRSPSSSASVRPAARSVS